MPLVAIVCGLLLMGVGVGGYLISKEDNPVTALIPAGWAILLIVPGLIAQLSPGTRKHAMHAAAAFGLLGFLLAAGRLAMVLLDDKPNSPLGLFSLSSMAVICAVFVALCIKSFRDARRNRA